MDRHGVRATPDTLTLSLLDEVRWACGTSHRFSIEFTARSPFTVARLRHDEALAKRPAVRHGRFKYTVALDSDPKVRVDAVLVVERAQRKTREA